jgi:hypothetical protein
MVAAGAAAGATGIGLLDTAPAYAAQPLDGAMVSDMDVRSMLLEISYATEIINPPKSDGTISFWMPIAHSDQEQEITDFSVRAPFAIHINTGPVYGNRMIHIAADRVRPGDRAILKYTIKRKTAGTISLDDDPSLHNRLTRREAWNEEIKVFTDKVVGSTKDPVSIGRKVYDALVDNLTYDKDIPGCGEGISTWTFKNKRGRCDDFHALFRTMMIYRGVPVRWEQGISLPLPSLITETGEFEGDCYGAHCWMRFYIGDGKWMPVDASEAAKRKEMREYYFGTLSPNRFKVSTGRDITLNPKQMGDPLNNFPYAYGEFGGIPMIYGHHYRNRIKYKLLDMEV